MNTTNILAVADAIEQHTIPWLGFNMSDYIFKSNVDFSGHNCGTVACIAGWAMAIKHGPDVIAFALKRSLYDDIIRVGSEPIGKTAAEWLGLTHEQRNNLFHQFGATADQAVRTLRHLAATGNVDWTV